MKVTIDRLQDTCYARGVTIVAPSAEAASRQKPAVPTLEYVKFVPYIQMQIPDDPLTQYTNDILGFIKQNLNEHSKCWIKAEEQNAVPFQKALEKISWATSNVSKYLDSTVPTAVIQNNHSLICFLAEALGDQNGGRSFSGNSEQKNLGDYTDRLNHDLLLTNYLQTEILRPCLDVVVENTDRKATLKIGEVTRGSSIYSKVIPLLSSDPTLQFEYTLAGYNLDKFDAGELEQYNISSMPWDFLKDSSPPNQLQSLDFTILDSILHHHPNIPKLLAQIQTMLKPGGFVYIHEWTTNLIIPLVMEVISDNLLSNNERTFGPFCSEDKWLDVIASANLEIIQKKSDGLLSSTFLCR